MKKILLLAVCCLMLQAAYAVPADPTPVKVTQPDGTTIMLRLVGDEYYHFNTTDDGYTVLNRGGRWEYATLSSGKLVSTGVQAHDVAVRSASETAMLATMQKRITDRQAVDNSRNARARRDSKNGVQRREPVVDYGKFRGLILLINFNDRKFLMDDPHGFYDDMSNTKDYKGYYTGTGWNRRFNSCTGSVRDYFYDQSMGQFDPVFDVIGPVEVPISVRECGENYSTIFKAALDSIDDEVDFTLYDSDSDGGIDMVFFMVAGYSASYSGNSSEYLWPHMSYLYGYNEDSHRWEYLVYDGMYMGRYASSTEIYGWESYGMTGAAGIGTVCHEFGHVLGLPDLYDTDYGDSGGDSNHPGDWDVMAGGSHANQGRTPVGYSIWERWELGWAEPEELSLGSHSIEAVDKSNAGFILQSPVEGEFFMFENRQKNKWDSALPSHGMVVARVDYTNPRVWERNDINCNPAHNYYELLRAGGSAENTPFPGNTGVTRLTATTSPGLSTWNGTPCNIAIERITETNGIITFDCEEGEKMNSAVEDFEIMATTTNLNEKGVQGQFAKWDFVNGNVTQNAAFGGGNGCEMGMPAAITMTNDFDANVYMISVKAVNKSSQESKLLLAYSLDRGANWQNVATNVVNGNSNDVIMWRLNMDVPARYRITRTAGNRNSSLLLDDFTIHYAGEARPVADLIEGDVNGDGKVDVEDVNAVINIILKNKTLTDFTGECDVNNDGKVDVEDVNAIINIILKVYNERVGRCVKVQGILGFDASSI
ncbi:MAG: M6 family metalloprotease domain-containing protein [Muribaculaceae bacterium]|nr:M6 family metalloprotease domain-containing protein [Muribaculaceae bacterium]